jgi:hypothetical protein
MLQYLMFQALVIRASPLYILKQMLLVSIWLPMQEREWNYTHTPEETSSCHPGRADGDEEEDETGGTESTETAEQEGEELN